MSDPNKRKLLFGLLLIIASFVCVMAIFYFLLDAHQNKLQEIDSLQEQLSFLDTQKSVLERKANALEEEMGKAIDLKKFIEEAQRTYDDDEKSRKEGTLWVDRRSQALIITLGAVNGLEAGTRLTVYDGKNKIGFVSVETPLDVISYVQPIGPTLSQLQDDYYRVVIE